MKRILKISFVLLLLISCVLTVYATITADVTLSTSKSKYSKDEEIVVTVKLTNLESEKGIIAFGAVLEYDKENLQYVSMNGKNGWSNPYYNEENGKFVTDRGSFATEDGEIFEIIFKAKTDKADKVDVTIKNIEVADGIEEDKFSPATLTISIGDDSGDVTDPDDENPDNNADDRNTNTNTNTISDNNTNTNTNTNTNKSTNTNNNTNTNTNTNTNKNNNQNNDNTAPNNQQDNLADKALPNAGMGRNIVILILIGVMIIVPVILFKKMEIMDKLLGNKKK